MDPACSAAARVPQPGRLGRQTSHAFVCFPPFSIDFYSHPFCFYLDPRVPFAGQATVRASITAGPSRAEPCAGCSPRSRSVVDWIISIAVAQNGCCLEQFPLPGRLVALFLCPRSPFSRWSPHSLFVLFFSVSLSVCPAAFTSCVSASHLKIIL